MDEAVVEDGEGGAAAGLVGRDGGDQLVEQFEEWRLPCRWNQSWCKVSPPAVMLCSSWQTSSL